MVILAFHNKHGQGPPAHLPMVLGVVAQTLLGRAVGTHLRQRNQLETGRLWRFHSIINALYKHSDTEKGNIKVHLFVCMPSKLLLTVTRTKWNLNNNKNTGTVTPLNSRF